MVRPRDTSMGKCAVQKIEMMRPKKSLGTQIFPIISTQQPEKYFNNYYKGNPQWLCGPVNIVLSLHPPLEEMSWQSVRLDSPTYITVN